MCQNINTKKVDWEKRFFDLSKNISSWSKDKSTKVGAIIADSDNRILSIGYNGFPSGLDDNLEDRHERPTKYYYSEHAERNAIYSAAKNGVSLNGAIMYLSWFPCSECTRAILQTGIKKVVCSDPNILMSDNNNKWEEDFKHSKIMLDEMNIDLFFVE